MKTDDLSQHDLYRIKRAKEDGWTNIRTVMTMSGNNDSYYDDDTEIFGCPPDSEYSVAIPHYTLQRLIAHIWNENELEFHSSQFIPFLFESKDAAEKMWNFKKEETDKRGEEAQWRGFRCFGIDSHYITHIAFYTLDEWFENAYSPENPEKSPA